MPQHDGSWDCEWCPCKGNWKERHECRWCNQAPRQKAQLEDYWCAAAGDTRSRSAGKSTWSRRHQKKAPSPEEAKNDEADPADPEGEAAAQEVQQLTRQIDSYNILLKKVKGSDYPEVLVVIKEKEERRKTLQAQRRAARPADQRARLAQADLAEENRKQENRNEQLAELERQLSVLSAQAHTKTNEVDKGENRIKQLEAELAEAQADASHSDADSSGAATAGGALDKEAIVRWLAASGLTPEAQEAAWASMPPIGVLAPPAPKAMQVDSTIGKGDGRSRTRSREGRTRSVSRSRRRA